MNLSGLKRLAALALLLAAAPPSSALEMPLDFGYNGRLEYLRDIGLLWELHRGFQPPDAGHYGERALASFHWSPRLYSQHLRFIRAQTFAMEHSDVPRVFGGYGVELRQPGGPDRRFSVLGAAPFFWGSAVFRRHWFADLTVRFTNEAASLEHYTGVTRSIARAGLTTGEIDRSSFGWRNDWALVEFGRGRQIIGPLASDNLALAGDAPAFERLVIAARHKRLTFRYFFGFLETVEYKVQAFQRYITGRSLHYANDRNLVLGVSEISILSGDNRPVDWAFLNPLAIHLEIEQNRRDNKPYDNSQNAMWTLDADWMATKSLRLTGSLLLDDFQLDAGDRKDTQDQVGLALRAAWTPVRRPLSATLLADYVQIGTFTTQHDYPYNNFVSRERYLGHPVGNDAERIRLGLRCLSRGPLAVTFTAGQLRRGENSLHHTPYRARSGVPKVRFPSGEVSVRRYIDLELDSQPHPRIALAFNGSFTLSQDGTNAGGEGWQITMRYALPF